MSLDGSGQRSLGLRPGNATNQFTSAAIADNGTVAAGLEVRSDCGPGDIGVNTWYCKRGDSVVLLTGGAVANIGNPEPCQRSISDVDISPDGQLVAMRLGLPTVDCPNSIHSGVAIAEAKAGGKLLSLVGDCSQPSFIDNSRIVAACTRPAGVHTIVAGQSTSAVWFETDAGTPGYPGVSRDFSHITWTADSHQRTSMNVWSLGGPPPAAPIGGCTATSQARHIGGSWAADNQTLVFGRTDDNTTTPVGPGEGVFPSPSPVRRAHAAASCARSTPQATTPTLVG